MKNYGRFKKEYLIQVCKNTLEHLHEMEVFLEKILEMESIPSKQSKSEVAYLQAYQPSTAYSPVLWVSHIIL